MSTSPTPPNPELNLTPFRVAQTSSGIIMIVSAVALPIIMMVMPHYGTYAVITLGTTMGASLITFIISSVVLNILGRHQHTSAPAAPPPAVEAAPPRDPIAAGKREAVAPVGTGAAAPAERRDVVAFREDSLRPLCEGLKGFFGGYIRAAYQHEKKSEADTKAAVAQADAAIDGIGATVDAILQDEEQLFHLTFGMLIISFIDSEKAVPMLLDEGTTAASFIRVLPTFLLDEPKEGDKDAQPVLDATRPLVVRMSRLETLPDGMEKVFLDLKTRAKKLDTTRRELDAAKLGDVAKCRQRYDAKVRNFHYALMAVTDLLVEPLDLQPREISAFLDNCLALGVEKMQQTIFYYFAMGFALLRRLYTGKFLKTYKNRLFLKAGLGLAGSGVPGVSGLIRRTFSNQPIDAKHTDPLIDHLINLLKVFASPLSWAIAGEGVMLNDTKFRKAFEPRIKSDNFGLNLAHLEGDQGNWRAYFAAVAKLAEASTRTFLDEFDPVAVVVAAPAIKFSKGDQATVINGPVKADSLANATTMLIGLLNAVGRLAQDEGAGAGAPGT